MPYDNQAMFQASEGYNSLYHKIKNRNLGKQFIQNGDLSAQGLLNFAQEKGLDERQIGGLFGVVKAFAEDNKQYEPLSKLGKELSDKQNMKGFSEYQETKNEDYTLTPGSKRYNKNNEQVAENPKTENVSELAKLIKGAGITDADAIQDIYEQAITKKITNQKGMRLTTNPDGTFELTQGDVPEKKKTMPAGEVSKMSEFKVYRDTTQQINNIVKSGKADTGPFEVIKKLMDNWGIMPNEQRIELRSLVARLPGVMYAMRGKQLSDKELQVALDMMPQMKLDDKAFAIQLNKFMEYMNEIFTAKKQGFRDAGYKVGESTPSIESFYMDQ